METNLICFHFDLLCNLFKINLFNVWVDIHVNEQCTEKVEKPAKTAV